MRAPSISTLWPQAKIATDKTQTERSLSCRQHRQRTAIRSPIRRRHGSLEDNRLGSRFNKTPFPFISCDHFALPVVAAALKLATRSFQFDSEPLISSWLRISRISTSCWKHKGTTNHRVPCSHKVRPKTQCSDHRITCLRSVGCRLNRSERRGGESIYHHHQKLKETRRRLFSGQKQETHSPLKNKNNMIFKQ